MKQLNQKKKKKKKEKEKNGTFDIRVYISSVIWNISKDSNSPEPFKFHAHIKFSPLHVTWSIYADSITPLPFEFQIFAPFPTPFPLPCYVFSKTALSNRSLNYSKRPSSIKNNSLKKLPNGLGPSFTNPLTNFPLQNSNQLFSLFLALWPPPHGRQTRASCINYCWKWQREFALVIHMQMR